MEYNNEEEMKKILVILMSMLLVLILFIPLVLSMTATVNVQEKYSEVNAGESIYFETDIKWPENDIRRDLRLEYSVKDKDGNEIAYFKVLKAIETQASFMDFINIPESTEPGIYKIYLNVSDYSNMTKEIAVSFRVISKKDRLNTYLPLILGFIGFLSILVLVELFMLMKKKK